MAAVSLLQENPEPSEDEIRLGLEGNLCRCTGYHNIVQRGAGSRQGRHVIPAAFEYERADSVDRAVELLGSDEDAKLLAGGHSLIPLLRLRFARPSLLVDIGRLGDLRYVREDGDRIAIGALTRHAEVVRDQLLAKKCKIVADAAHLVGDPQVRHRGTIGGSIAHGDPASDLATVLLTLDADLVAARPERRAHDSGGGVLPRPVRDGARAPGGARRDPRSRPPRARTSSTSAGRTTGRPSVSRRRASTVPSTSAWRAWARLRCGRRASKRRSREGTSAAEAAERATEGADPPSDINGSSEYRAHLAQVLVGRALAQL